jgi:hypothetical protein
MGDEDDIDQVKEENDGVMSLGGGCTRIYMGDVDGVGRVRKEGQGVKLGGGWTHVDIGGVWWFRPQNNQRGLVVSASKPSKDDFLVWSSKPGTNGLVARALKLSVVDLIGLGFKTGKWRINGYVVVSRSLRQGEAKSRRHQVRWIDEEKLG